MWRKIGRNGKVGIVVFVFAALAIGIWLFYLQNGVKPYLQVTPEIQQCADEKKSTLHGTYPEKINVRFKSNVTDKSAMELVESYGLVVSGTSHVRLDNSYFLTVDVPKDQEFEWMCEFERSELVSFSTSEMWGGAV